MEPQQNKPIEDNLEAEAEPYYMNGVTDSNVSDDNKSSDNKVEPKVNDMLRKIEVGVSNTQKDDDVPPEKDNNKQLQPEVQSTTTKIIDKPEENVLTVIDGPLAKGKDESSLEGTVHNTPSPSVTSHTPNSSIGDSSLGELLGESAVLLENGSTSPESSNEKLLSMKSTEKPRSPKKEKSISQPPGHVVSKSDEGVLTTAAASDVREKPPLKRVTSLPPDNNTAAAAQKVRSPHKPTHNRERTNSSQDLVSSITEDDDDDDENDIPPHIQSKIVEKSPAERYIRFKEKLGSGAYKDVYRAYDTIEGIEVAWNVVKLSGVPKAERVRIVNEVRLLERLHHQNIISFHGSWVNRETERVIFVTEILSSGTLKSFVQKVQLIRWKIFKRWAIQILKGLEYLHSQDPPIIHRDLKCDNIFINGTSGDLRIGDFGLSTAISKKNQPLSVLGTPEFMAPELYDENYNEKVDIYAFGMLLLEIITRDVPYHECTNPAQIYKKVTQGIPPASLRRVKSVEARNFIQTCLGIGEDASTRPSASDLLKHEFLTKKLDDEATIEVEPAVEDMVIEEAKNSMTFSDTGSERSGGSNGGGKKKKEQNSKYASSIDGHEIPSRGAERPGEGKPPTGKDNGAVLAKSNTKSMDSKDIKSKSSAEKEQGGDDDDDDHFGEMPENEANMKKVTVLMGRGTALDDSEPPTKEVEGVSLSTTPPPAEIKTSTLPRSDSESIGSIPQYKVSAVPPIDQQDMGGAKPYPKDEINLALTIPDESQTTIEFDFDLVNDDPVQVAREMVMELEEVPDNAVLDISEAISGVARKARMKQNQWGKLQQHQQDMLQQQQQHSQSMMSIHSQQGSVPQHQHSQSMMSMPSQGSISQGSVPMQQQQQGIQTPQGIMMPPPQQHMYGSATGYPPPQGGYQNPGLVQPQLAAPPGNESIMSGQGGAVQAQPQHQQVVQAQPPIPPPPAPSQMSTPQMQHPQQHNVQPVQQQQQPASLPSSPAPIPQSTQQQQQQLPQQTMTRSSSMEINPNISQPADMITPRQLAPSAPPPVSTQAPLAQPMPQQGSSSSIPQQQQVQMPPHAQASMESQDGSEADNEEIRKLELEFEKKMQRAKKSYGTRMDNLHRSKEEAESQHQKILEKHEKERIEFEKRVKLAEEEQTRRLNQIEKEFMEKKKEARQQNRAAQPPTEVGAQPTTQNGSTTGDIKPPLHGGHKRSSSNFDNSLQPHVPIPDAHHKRTSSDSDLNEMQTAPPRPPIPRPPTTGGSSATSNRDRSSSISSDEKK